MKDERAHRTTNTTLSLIGIAYISYRRLCVWSSSPSRKVTEMTVMERISFLQNDNKMKIKMNGVNHVESPIITAVHSLLIL